MPTKRDIETRLHRLEKRHRRRESPTRECDELTEEQDPQIDEIVASLSDEKRAELRRRSAKVEEASDEAVTGEFGLADAESAYLDVLTGGDSRP